MGHIWGIFFFFLLTALLMRNNTRFVSSFLLLFQWRLPMTNCSGLWWIYPACMHHLLYLCPSHWIMLISSHWHPATRCPTPLSWPLSLIHHHAWRKAFNRVNHNKPCFCHSLKNDKTPLKVDQLEFTLFSMLTKFVVKRKKNQKKATPKKGVVFKGHHKNIKDAM